MCGWDVAAQYLYDRSKPHPLYSFGSPHGDVSYAIEEVAEEEVDVESDGECVNAHADLHNSISQTSLIRQKLTADDNGMLLHLTSVNCHSTDVLQCMVPFPALSPFKGILQLKICIYTLEWVMFL